METISIDQDCTSYRYGIISTPELNDQEYVYVSGSADEDRSSVWKL